MAWLRWMAQSGFEFLQTASILVGLFATIHTMRRDIRERKIQNQFALTAAHRELWSKLYEKPELARILRAEVNLADAPATTEEELFVHLLILHLQASFKARLAGMEFDDDAVAADIRDFFRLPIPHAVWEKSKGYQGHEFVAYVAGGRS